jgi:hypothetical protein
MVGDGASAVDGAVVGTLAAGIDDEPDGDSVADPGDVVGPPQAPSTTDATRVATAVVRIKPVYGGPENGTAGRGIARCQ